MLELQPPEKDKKSRGTLTQFIIVLVGPDWILLLACCAVLSAVVVDDNKRELAINVETVLADVRLTLLNLQAAQPAH
jgi:hypothetical protein